MSSSDSQAGSSLQAFCSSTPNFQPIFEKALEEYKRTTGKDLTAHPLAAEINGCATPQAILTVLEGKANDLNQFQRSKERLTKWLDPTVNILGALSATIGQGVGLLFPPTTIIFSGIGILLVAAKNTAVSREKLVELFDRIESFFERIKVYTKVPPTPHLVDALAKIMAEVLSILAIATKGMKKKRLKIFAKQLVGANDIEDALRRFDKLGQGELLMVTAQVSTDTRVLKDDAKETKAHVKEIISKMDTRDRGMLLGDLKTWLSPPDPSTNYELGLEAYHRGTATWFIEGKTFQEWDSTGSLLWIHGKPGSGKSILCTAIIQRILSLSDGGRSSVAYFYFDFRDEMKKHRRNLLPSLLVQLATQSIPCCNIMSSVYSAHGDGKRPPGEEVLMQCLKDMLTTSPQHPMYIIMDAIDECPDSSGVRSPRAQVLSFVRELVELRLTNLHICVTSRPEIDIRNCLEPLMSLHVSLHDQAGHQEDISNYIKSEVDFIAHDKRWRDGDKELVLETLSEKADGMFRWVFCQLEMLRLCVRSRVRQFVNELPDSLDETYERVLMGIPKTNRDYVRRLLQCLVVAIRPLCVDELARILTFDPDGIESEVAILNADSLPEDQEQELLSACPSLITITNGIYPRAVQFSHFSVKEFLTSGRLSTSSEDISRYHILPKAAHMTLAQISLGVLLHLDDRVDRWSAWDIPLARYAAEYWVSHVQVAGTSSHVMPMMGTLFDLDKPHFAAWVRIYNIDRLDRNQERDWDPDRATAKPLYYAALCGFYDLVEHLVNNRPLHINDLGGEHNYPLVAALHNGHIQIANLLLQHGANVDERGTDGQTPLHRAIRFVDDPMFGAARFLLEHGADPNVQRWDLRTPLHLAAAWGNEKIMFHPESAPVHETDLVQLLLEYGANVHEEDGQDQTPLYRVFEDYHSSGNSFDIVQLLVERGADVNKRDKDHQTPLHLASYRQHLKSVQLLLNHGANVDAVDLQGRTSLHRVFENIILEDGFHFVLLLMEHGADVNARDKNQDTPLHLASWHHHLEPVRVLLDHGANLHAENTKGQTPCHRVFDLGFISEGGADILRLLVDRGADVNPRDKDHQTPLHLASYHRRLESVQVLLDLGANVNMQDSQGRTPLHRVFEDIYLSFGDCLGVVQLLVERGANVNARDRDHETPLHGASYSQLLEPAQVLLDNGANVNAVDKLGTTPLHRLFGNPPEYNPGHYVILQLLMQRGADVNARDMYHQTPLHLASSRQHLESVRELLDHGANVNAETITGWSPLREVLNGPSISEDGFGVVQLLVEHGADLSTREQDLVTPLHLASFFQHLELVQVLLDRGANVNAKDNVGQTPLHRACSKPPLCYPGGYDIPELLINHGVDVNARDEVHETPLHLASRLGLIEGVWILLKHGADLNMENKEGKIPFQLARERIREDREIMPSKYFNRTRRAECVALMGLLYNY